MALRRNKAKPGQHTFVVQGTDKLHFVHLPRFHMASGRRQFIFSADLSQTDLARYQEAVSASKAVMMLRNTEADKLLLDDIRDGSTFAAEVFEKGRFVAVV